MSESVRSVFSSMQQGSKEGFFGNEKRKGDSLGFLFAILPKGRGGLFPSAMAPDVVIEQIIKMKRPR